MSGRTKIEWTEATWNPVTGCTKVSPGCDHCYAERITERFHGKGSFANVKLHPEPGSTWGHPSIRLCGCDNCHTAYAAATAHP